MESKQDKSEWMAKAFLNDLGVKNPDSSQIALITKLDEYKVREHIVRKLVDEGKTSGQIAVMTGKNINTIKSLVRKIKGDDVTQ